MAGSERDGVLLAKHIAGINNRTTDAILDMYKTLPPTKGALSKPVRNAKAQILAPIASWPLTELKSFGFDVSKKSLSAAREYVEKTDPLSTLPDNRGGRKRHVAVESGEIAGKWARLSYVGSHRGRVFYGSEKKARRKIQTEIENEMEVSVSLSTVR